MPESPRPAERPEPSWSSIAHLCALLGAIAALAGLLEHSSTSLLSLAVGFGVVAVIIRWRTGAAPLKGAWLHFVAGALLLLSLATVLVILEQL